MQISKKEITFSEHFFLDLRFFCKKNALVLVKDKRFRTFERMPSQHGYVCVCVYGVI